jgi:hypothetical protein
MQPESWHFSLKTQSKLLSRAMKKSDLEGMDVVESHLFHGNDKFSLSHEELIEKEKECLKFILQQVFSYLAFWVLVFT